MKIQYFPEDDILYIDLAEKNSVESEEVASGIVVDFDENGFPVGIEISNASKIISLEQLEISNFPLADLILKKAA
ncbi:DUF2283 domain-containing protein [Thermodesulfatator atlanticus]|uniref:DUF2283 domain-containing protein n=1 Tax=Thermodesulfatator atlanticus TaxID=501497 RepID=UPI0003B32389|nr:DUF2283 domain-containing protein [Thermodesulfatator atlanticus]